MSVNNHIAFIQKITRKLADAFLQINQLCIQELKILQNNHNQVQNNDQNQVIVSPFVEIPQQIENNEESQDEEQIQKQQKQTKTKKIKKQNQAQEQKQGQQIRSKKKIKKISHKPKAPASSFLIFFKQQQGNIAKSYPMYGVTQLTKVAAKCWNQLSSEQKQPYIKLGDEQRKLYQIRMQQYRIEFPHEIAQKQKIRKQIKRQKDKEKKINKQSQTPKKQKIQVHQKVVPQVPENKPINQKVNQQHILISSKQSESDNNQQEDDSLGMV